LYLASLCASQAQERVRLVPQLGQGVVNSVAISPDGRFALTGNDDGTARLWDMAAGRQVLSFAGDGTAIRSAAFSADGRFVVTGSSFSAELWDAATGKRLRQFRQPLGDVISVAFSPDCRFVLLGTNVILPPAKPDQDSSVELFDVSTGQQIQSFKEPSWSVPSLAFSPDGRLVLTASSNSTARLWDAATGQQIRAFSVARGGVRSVAFSPDGKSVFLGADGDDLANGNVTALLADVATGQVIREFPIDAFIIRSGSFSPDGRSLLVSTDIANPANADSPATMNLLLWDVATGKRRLSSPFPEFLPPCWARADPWLPSMPGSSSLLNQRKPWYCSTQ
jgi:WD40 repeat protein